MQTQNMKVLMKSTPILRTFMFYACTEYEGFIGKVLQFSEPLFFMHAQNMKVLRKVLQFSEPLFFMHAQNMKFLRKSTPILKTFVFYACTEYEGFEEKYSNTQDLCFLLLAQNMNVLSKSAQILRAFVFYACKIYHA